MSSERPTLHQVAAEAGVSIATVSRVFQGTTPTSESTRARVLAAAKVVGYEPPRRLSRATERRYQSYGMILPALGTRYTSELILGCGESASQDGQSVGVVVAEHRHDLTTAVRELVDAVDGLVVVGPSLSDAVVLSLVRKLPVVLVGRPALPGSDSVCAQNASCAQQMTEHLLVTHRRSHLVFVGDPDASPEVAERYRGFRSAHAAADVPTRRPPLRVPYVEAAGLLVAEELLRRRVRVDGLVCANDALAISVMSRLQDGGVAVPEDMAVVGWDDVMAARYLRPALTTVREPVRQMGRTAAELLRHRIAGHAPGKDPYSVPAEVIIRASCGCVEPPRQLDSVSAAFRR